MKPIAVVFAAALLFAAAKITKSSVEERVGTPVVDTRYIQQDETGEFFDSFFRRKKTCLPCICF